MFYYDLLKKELFDYINSEYSKKNIKDVPNKSSFNIEIPTNKKFGDVSTNIAMVFAKKMGLSPRDLAFKLSKHMNKENFIEKLEVVGPGFLNIFFKKSFWQDQLKVYFKNVNSFNYKIVKKNICLEFVSANPTGPLHAAHARGAIIGDVLANLLSFSGYNVIREYYINDAGSQIIVLSKSVYLRYCQALGDVISNIPAGLYPGDYLMEVGQFLATKFGDRLKSLPEADALAKIRPIAIDMIMVSIKKDLARLGVKMDVYSSENELVVQGKVSSAIEKLQEKGLIYRPIDMA